eukprot:TCONS_00014744-protein
MNKVVICVMTVFVLSQIFNEFSFVITVTGEPIQRKDEKVVLNEKIRIDSDEDEILIRERRSPDPRPCGGRSRGGGRSSRRSSSSSRGGSSSGAGRSAGLSDWAIIGIVIAGLVAFPICSSFCYYFKKKCCASGKKNKKTDFSMTSK